MAHQIDQPPTRRVRPWIRDVLVVLGTLAATIVGVIGLGALGLSCLGSRERDAPIRPGMTVAEVGKARPGGYTRDRTAREYPLARATTPATRKAFTGDLVLREPHGPEIRFPFEDGRRTAFDSPPKIPRSVLVRVPKGATVSQAVERLGSKAEMRLEGIGEGSITHDLPADAEGLARYSGTLSSYEVVFFEIYSWEVTFENGRVTKFEEERSEFD